MAPIDTMKKGIITHGGLAHLDDFLSTCLVIHKYGNIEWIERRDPTPDEIRNRRIWKLDVGGGLDPKRKSFDHHQEDMDDCTLSLLLKEWNMWDKALEVHPWLRVTVIMDTGGYKKLYSRLGITPDTIYNFHSFVQECMLDLFRSKTRITKKDPLFGILDYIGCTFFDYIDDYYNTLSLVRKRGKIRVIGEVPVIQCLDATPSKTLNRILSMKRKEEWGRGGIAIFPNDRPVGTVALKRYDGDDRVDFRRLPDDDRNVLFIHRSGFFAVLRSMPDYQIDQYVGYAIK